MVGLQTLTTSGVGPCDLGQGPGIARALPLDGEQTTGEEEVEVILGRGEHGIVRCRAHVGLAGCQISPGGPGDEDRVGEAQNRGQASQRRITTSRWGCGVTIGRRGQPTQEQRAAAHCHDPAVDRLNLAVEAIPGWTEKQGRKPDALACCKSAIERQTSWRAMATSRSRVPARRIAPARSIGSMTWPGMSGAPSF